MRWLLETNCRGRPSWTANGLRRQGPETPRQRCFESRADPFGNWEHIRLTLHQLLYVIGSASLQSRDGHLGFKVNLKAISSSSNVIHIFFVSKQPTVIEINDIHGVIFSRVVQVQEPQLDEPSP
ncbi:hypothetical protein BYT27DRAFT_6469266 [Phlegmacium glaucopus]|nr:hypothetical protein BYT27DRAFT_6469266 [Phlegmacium glaucopus]